MPLQDHMAGEAKSLSPKQCAVMDMALDTIKVSWCGAAVSCGPVWGGGSSSVSFTIHRGVADKTDWSSSSGRLLFFRTKPKCNM